MHGFVEAHSQDSHAEVDGVAGQVAFGPAPVALLDDQTGIGGQSEVARSVTNFFGVVLLADL